MPTDTERLDWIEKTHPLGLLDVMSTDTDIGYGFTAITGDRTLYGSFRGAIDAAMDYAEGQRQSMVRADRLQRRTGG